MGERRPACAESASIFGLLTDNATPGSLAGQAATRGFYTRMAKAGLAALAWEHFGGRRAALPAGCQELEATRYDRLPRAGTCGPLALQLAATMMGPPRAQFRGCS